jgi:hypothetical protein
MGFIHFMASPAGRIIRFLAGAILILVGLRFVGGAGGAILAIIGLVPLVAGTFDLCLLAPLFKLPISGRRIRAETSH